MFNSFKGRLISLLVFIMFTMSVVNFVQFKIALNQQSEDILGSFNIHSESVANAIAAQFFERYGDVQAFAKNEGINGLDPANIANIFDEYVKIYGIYDVVLMVDMQGNYISSNTILFDGTPIDQAALKGKNYSNEPWFKAVSQGQYTEEQSKALVGTYVEDAHLDPITTAAMKKDQWGNSFSAVFKNKSGTPVGIITNRANFKWVELEAQISYQALKRRGFPSAEVTVLNKKGEIIVDYDPAVKNGSLDVHRDFGVLGKSNMANDGYDAAVQLVAGKSGSQTAKNGKKDYEQIIGYSKIESAKMLSSVGWGTMVRIKSDEALHIINASLMTFYISSAVMFVFFGVVVFVLATRIVSQLATVTEAISDAGKKVSSAGEQLSGASQQVSSGSTEAASSLEETVSSIEELSSMVKLNADNAKQAKALSQSSTKSAEDGENEIRTLISSMREISKSSKKIEEIINVIDDIAFQTNLLALNAAVEAARAGEQGKGFAVVAEAVRNLAQRSASAAKDITSLIKDSVAQIDHGTKVADSSGNVLKNIVTSVKKVSDLNHEIASASAEQANGIGQISKAMNELDRSTQQNASAAEEVAATANQMSSQSDDLKSLVGELTGLLHGQNSHSAGTPVAAKLTKDTREKDREEPPKASGGSSFRGSTEESETKEDKADRAPKMKVVNGGGKSSIMTRAEEVEKMIPFNDEPSGKLGTTDGF